MKETMKMVTDQFGMGKDLVFEQEPVEAPAPAPEPDVPATPEQELESVSQEVAAPVEQEIKPVKESRAATNFKALKSEAARLAKERDDMKALLEQYQQQQRNTSEQKQTTPVSDDIEIDADAYAEGKQIKKLLEEMRSIKKDLQQSRAQTHNIAVKASLIAEHPDFERVVTKENLTALELSYPHLARSINVSDPYTAGKACYDLIKQFGIDQDEAPDTQITKAMIAQNLAKPKPAAAMKGGRATNESTMGRASEFYTGELTDQMKKQFHKEMVDAMKGYGGYKP